MFCALCSVLCARNASPFRMQLTFEAILLWSKMKHQVPERAQCTNSMVKWHYLHNCCQNGIQQSSERRTTIRMHGDGDTDAATDRTWQVNTKHKYAIGFSTFQTLYISKFYLIIICVFSTIFNLSFCTFYCSSFEMDEYVFCFNASRLQRCSWIHLLFNCH